MWLMPAPIEVTVGFEEVFVKADPWLGSRDRIDNIGTIYFNGFPIYSHTVYGTRGEEAEKRLFKYFAKDIEPERETRLA